MKSGQIVLLPRVLKPRQASGDYMRGDDAKAVDRALARAGFRKWGFFNGTYGTGKVARVNKLRARHGLPLNGEYDAAVHRLLSPYFDLWGAKLMNDMAHRDNGATRAVAIMLELYNSRDQVGYTQSGLRMMIVRLRLNSLAKIVAWLRAGRRLEEDCSSGVTGIDYGSGNPDPNNRGYDGEGYTGTLVEQGVRIARSELVAGACKGFYDSPGKRGFPYTHVVDVMYVRPDGTVLLWSHGKSSDPTIRDADTYRPEDFVMWRRYPVAA